MIVKTMPGTATAEHIAAWFHKEAARRWAGLVYVYGVQASRAACATWLAHSREAREWNALFVLRYRDGPAERWLLGTGGQ